MKAPEILRHAADLIDERGRQRDKPDGERSMKRAVQAFNALYGHALSEQDGWNFMAVLKMARGNSLDDVADGCAYRALAGEALLKPNPDDQGGCQAWSRGPSMWFCRPYNKMGVAGFACVPSRVEDKR